MPEKILDNVQQWISDRNYAAFKAALRELEDADIAELLDELDPEPCAVAFRLLGSDQATVVFSLLGIDSQEELIKRLGDESLARLINDMAPDDRTVLLEELPSEVSARLMDKLQGHERLVTRTLFSFPPDSVGRLMTPEYVAVRPNWTASDVLKHIRAVAPQKETVNDLYVIDARGRLLDRIELLDVVMAPADNTVEDLMAGPTEEPSMQARDDQESAVELFKKYDMPTLPVVDSHGVMVGIVTADDVLDLQEEQDTEDFQRMAGVAALEDPYFQTSYSEMLRKRLPWLALLLFAELITAVVILRYEKSLGENLMLIVLFSPMVFASAGNAGSQMSGLIIRGLAVGEMDLGDWLIISTRELFMGLSLGAVLGAMAWAAAAMFGRPQRVGLILAISMLTALTVANLAGALIPLGLKKVKMDPAVMSAPLVASLMDILSALIFFGTATIVFLKFGAAS